MKTILILVLMGVIIAFIAIIFLLNGLTTSKYRETNINTSFAVIVEKSERYMGYLYINYSLQIGHLSMRKGADEISLDEFVQPKDSLIKDSGKAIVTVVRGDSNYVFKRFSYYIKGTEEW